MTKALQVDPDIGLREVLELSQSDRYSVQYSPFLRGPGGQLGGTIVRSASPLKGDTKREDEDFDDYRERMLEKYEGTSMEGIFEEGQGLAAAVDMAEDKEDVEGVAVIRQNGEYKILPQASAELAQEGEAGATMVAQNLDSASEALEEYVDASGRQLRRPRIA